MKILITGGAGFIGSHLAEAMLEQGHTVHAIDNLSTGRWENVENLVGNPRFSITVDTILKRDVMDPLIANCDQVYHLAAAVGVKYIIDNPLLSLQTNITGTEIVLEMANKHKKKVLLASTSEIYGKSDKVPFREEDDRVLGSTHISRWSYSCAKAIDEFLALAYYREKKLPVVIVRCFNTVGPRQTGQYGMVLPKFVKNALMGHPLTVFGSGQQIRCFGDVADVVCGMMALMSDKAAEGQVFNIGNDQPVSIEDLAKQVIEMTNSSSRIDYIPYEEAYERGFEDMLTRIPDLSKIKNQIGYSPKNDLACIIGRVIEFYQK